MSYDASGKQYLGVRTTNVPRELFPGTYVVELNGTGQPLTVRAGQTATVTAGEAVVVGTGTDTYFVYDASGNRQLSNRRTNAPLELFPGSYVVEREGVRQSCQVVAGQRTILR